MLQNYDLTKNTKDSYLLSWESSVATDISWVFVDGQLFFGPSEYDETQRYDDIDIYEDTIITRDVTVNIDLHDFDYTVDFPDEGSDEGILPKSIYDSPNTTPTIGFDPVDSAERYRLYHAEGNALEVNIYEESAGNEDENNRVEIEVPEQLNGKKGIWNFFRVESIDSYGNESIRGLWRYWTYSPPAKINNMSVENGSVSGKFSITIIE